jgi:hypothetical protein
MGRTDEELEEIVFKGVLRALKKMKQYSIDVEMEHYIREQKRRLEYMDRMKAAQRK